MPLLGAFFAQAGGTQQGLQRGVALGLNRLVVMGCQGHLLGNQAHRRLEADGMAFFPHGNQPGVGTAPVRWHQLAHSLEEHPFMHPASGKSVQCQNLFHHWEI